MLKKDMKRIIMMHRPPTPLLFALMIVLLLLTTNFAQTAKEIFFYQLPPMKCINGICITLKELNADIHQDGTQTAYFLITFDTTTKNNLFWNSYTKSNIEIAETTKTKLFDRNFLIAKTELEIYDVINERTEQEIENADDETGKRTTNTINKYVYTIGKISDMEAKSLQKTKYVIALKVPWTQLTWNLSTIYGKIDPDITGCGTFSSAGYYTLLNDIVYDLNNASTGSYYCFTFTSNNGTTIDLNGKTVTITNFSNLYSFYAYVFRSNQKLHITNGNIIIRPLGNNISTSEIGVYRFDQSGVTDDYHIISNVNITIENRGYVFRTVSTNNNYNVKLVNSTFVGKPRDDQTKCDNLDNCGPYGIFIYPYLNIRNTPYMIENSTIIIQNGTGSTNAIFFGWTNNIDYVINNSKIIINCFNSTYGNIPVLFALVDRINTSLVVENSYIEICLPVGFGAYMIRFESNDGNVYMRFYNNTFNLTRFTSSSFMLNIGPHNTSSSNNTIEFFDNKFYTFTKNYTGGTSQLVRFLYYTGGTGSQAFYNGSVNRTYFWNISSYNVADTNCDGFADSGQDYPELRVPSLYSTNLLVDYYPVYYNASCQQPQIYFYTTIQSPQNITYNKTSVEINYTLFNNTPVTCYYSFDLGNTKTQLTNCQNTTITHSAEGFYTLRIYLTNDSGTTWNFTEVNYTILTVVNVNLTSPKNITYYSLPINLQYNFTNSTIVSCAYAIDNNPFVDISCQNTTINVVEGFHNLTLRINNSVRTNFSYVNFTYVVPKINLTLISPTNTTYYASNIDLLYSYSHNTNETPKCYYRIDNNQFNEITNCENITLTSISFGVHSLELIVNNTYTSNSSIIYFTVLNPMPSISLINPQNITYFALPIPIQYTYFSPTSPYICKYNLNDGNNVTLTNCQNTSLTSLGYGTYKLTIYISNEYEENSDFVYFTYRQPNNNVVINSPQNTTYSVQNINLEYTITNETQIISCEYKIDNGNWISIPNCQNITITNLNDGTYYLQIRIRDVFNFYSYDSVYFTIQTPDIIPPNIVINNPINKTYTTNIIPFSYVVTDDKSAVAQCNYTIAYTNLTVIKNMTNANCSDSFSEILTYNQSYLFNISAVDTANNFAYNSVIFTIKEPSAQGFGGELFMESLVLLLTGIGMIYIASKKIFGRAFNTIIKYIGLFFIPFAIITLTSLDDDVKTGLTSALILIIVVATVFEIFAVPMIWIAKALNQKEIAHSLYKWFRHEGEE